MPVGGVRGAGWELLVAESESETQLSTPLATNQPAPKVFGGDAFDERVRSGRVRWFEVWHVRWKRSDLAFPSPLSPPRSRGCGACGRVGAARPSKALRGLWMGRRCSSNSPSRPASGTAPTSPTRRPSSNPHGRRDPWPSPQELPLEPRRADGPCRECGVVDGRAGAESSEMPGGSTGHRPCDPTGPPTASTVAWTAGLRPPAHMAHSPDYERTMEEADEA